MPALRQTPQEEGKDRPLASPRLAKMREKAPLSGTAAPFAQAYSTVKPAFSSPHNSAQVMTMLVLSSFDAAAAYSTGDVRPCIQALMMRCDAM